MSGTGGGRFGSPALLDALVVVVAIVLAFAATGLVPAHPVRVLVTMSTLLLVPGYVLTLAVFPAGGTVTTDTRFGKNILNRSAQDPAGLDTAERAALSFGLSVVVLPLLALCLAAFNVGIDATSVLTAVTAFTVPVLVAGLIRRARVPATIRYGPSLADLRSQMGFLNGPSTVDAALNVALVLVTIGAVASLGLALAMPQDGSSYTQVSLLTEDLSGELSATGYPTDLSRNQTGEIVLSVTNHENVPTEYAVAVQLQQIGPDGSVTDRSELDRFQIETQPEEQRHVRHEFRIRRPGESQRVVYLLYRGDAPVDPTIDSAYRNVYFWVDVNPMGSESGVGEGDSPPADVSSRVSSAGKAVLPTGASR